MVEKIEEQKIEIQRGFSVAETPVDFRKLIVKDGKEIDALELLVDLANKVERAGLI